MRIIIIYRIDQQHSDRGRGEGRKKKSLGRTRVRERY